MLYSKALFAPLLIVTDTFFVYKRGEWQSGLWHLVIVSCLEMTHSEFSGMPSNKRHGAHCCFGGVTAQ